ncbi:signal peptidase I [Eubacterium sp.]|uniref:signal peptidase I n=1 Tax=Eubacterium sp. TaxID=142586 RepID=UPI0025D55D90|nr:signal peptidase I [Eubacterium sp.]MCR5629848.1 signal peptidase I [Eubacterium sp.]
MSSNDFRKDLKIRGSARGDGAQYFFKEALSWVMVFVVAFAIAYFVDNVIIINATVPSESMQNTIMKHDRMVGNRLAYRFGEPKRGDIVIFEYPDDVNDPDVKKPKLFVKRLIGLPGEKVEIKDGTIYITNRQDGTTDGIYEEDYLAEDWIIGNSGYSFDIPEGQYLMLGDNRNNSKDSRYWKDPFVERKEIKAKALFVYWPFKHAGILKSKRNKDTKETTEQTTNKIEETTTK